MSYTIIEAVEELLSYLTEDAVWHYVLGCIGTLKTTEISNYMRYCIYMEVVQET